MEISSSPSLDVTVKEEYLSEEDSEDYKGYDYKIIDPFLQVDVKPEVVNQNVHFEESTEDIKIKIESEDYQTGGYNHNIIDPFLQVDVKPEVNQNVPFEESTEDIKIKVEPCLTKDLDVREETNELPGSNYQSAFKNYVQRYNKVKKHFQCCYCVSTFFNEAQLVQHTKIHIGRKPGPKLFQCGHCDFSSSCKMGLKVHMRTHTGEKPFQCDICGCRFSTKYNLQSHLKIHEEPFKCEKRFECITCGCKFSRNSNLQQHLLRMHSAEKLF